MFIKKGDTVKVISGNAKGATGKVLEVLVKEQKVIVEGINKVSRHTRPNNEYPDGGIIQKEAPIAISNVMYYEVVDGKGQTTRIGYKVNEKGKKVRYSLKSGKELDK
jgi:large subunit ribosomal protein L24